MYFNALYLKMLMIEIFRHILVIVFNFAFSDMIAS